MWIAHYLDKESLRQIDSEGNEHQFRDITQEKLEKFEIITGNKAFSVNLVSGEVNLCGLKLSFTESRQAQHRLIYFRRVRQTMSTAGEQTTETESHFGFQTNLDGRNHKRIFVLTHDGKLMQE